MCTSYKHIYSIVYHRTTCMSKIRNFCIIAHIDHGKSTLADRLLEHTHTVEKRKMKDQLLDQLELERERGITIKMAPVQMHYTHKGEEYIFNLIDTPGHPDFGYEVSRALEAVEGAILLVDGTQGIQAQTLSNFYAAKKAGLSIIGAVNKVDLHIPSIETSIIEVADLIGADPHSIHKISGKTGEGVEGLLADVIERFPSPRIPLKAEKIEGASRALIFDSFYDDHRGIIATVRVFDGDIEADQQGILMAQHTKIKTKEVGVFSPGLVKRDIIKEGTIGYVVTGLKDPHLIKIGDTLLFPNNTKVSSSSILPGYKEPNPVVFVSFFPDNQDEYDDLKKSLERLKLNDSSFTYEPDTNEVLGRGFKGGFLGKLHFEIISQRLEREFDVETTTSFPSVAYKVKTIQRGKETILPHLTRDEDGYLVLHNPKDLPDEYERIEEPMIDMSIVSPPDMLGSILSLQEQFRWEGVETETLGDRVILHTRMPLAELISDFDDKLKSISQGFASFSYESSGYKQSNLERLDILVAGEEVPGLTRILPRETVEREARAMVKKLKETLPGQQFAQAIQGKALGRIIARETIPAMKKDVTGHLYGGDRTRKTKLWKKQKEGKKKLLSMARVKISAQDFKKLLEK